MAIAAFGRHRTRLIGRLALFSALPDGIRRSVAAMIPAKQEQNK